MRASRLTFFAAAAAAVSVCSSTLAQEKAAPDLVKLMPRESGLILSCEVKRVIHEPVTMRVVEEFFKRAEVKEGLENFAQFTGLDPRKNITRFCLSGDVGRQGVRLIAIEGSFDPQHIKNTLSQFLPDGPAPYRTFAIYTVPDDKGGPNNYLAFANDSLLLFGQDAAVRAALDVCDATAKAVEPAPMIGDLLKMDPKSLVRLGAQNVDKIKGDPNPIQPHLRSLVGNITSASDGIVLSLRGMCDTADAAKEIGQIAEGLLAFARLQVDFERKPEARELFTVVGPTSVTTKDKEVIAALTVSQTSLDKLYERITKKKGRDPVGGNAEQLPGTE